MSFDRLISKIISMKNPTVAGLDPKLDYVPSYIRKSFLEEDGETLKAASKAIFRYNQMLIDALCDIVPAVKLQAAYYELYGHHGVKTMERTIRYAKLKGMYVITDGKRNDIGATMEAYTAAHLGSCVIGTTECEPFRADALTVNGYLGTDGISPLLGVCKERDKGIFVLCKTSNPSSGEFQDLLIDGVPLYARMGDKCEEWGEDTVGTFGYSAVGAVVGENHHLELVGRIIGMKQRADRTVDDVLLVMRADDAGETELRRFGGSLPATAEHSGGKSRRHHKRGPEKNAPEDDGKILQQLKNFGLDQKIFRLKIL